MNFTIFNTFKKLKKHDSAADECTNLCILHDLDPLQCSPVGEEKDWYHCMFELIKGWIHECLHGHEFCNNPGPYQDTQARILPSRLLYVGSSNGEEDPRLVVLTDGEPFPYSSEERPRLTYATLSYCWGSNYQKCLLTEANIKDLTCAIPYKSLPRTIQEAVSICRVLSVRYLWVDALCIVQESGKEAKDWQFESQRIGYYYSNAVFNIAATWAGDNKGGCLPFRIARPGFRPESVQDDRMFFEVDGSKLLRRGWVLQEISVSRRVLYFTKSGVFWQCQSKLASDCSPKGFSIAQSRGAPALRSQVFERFAKFLMEIDSFSEDQHLGRHREWYELIYIYSTMEFSYPADTFAALSGLCKFFDRGGRDKYLAGIWGSSLRTGLSWVSRDVRPRRELDKRAPSWSWAAATRAVEFRFNHECKLPGHEYGHVHLVSSNVQLAYTDPHGQIKSASLRVQAPVRALLYSHIESADDGSDDIYLVKSDGGFAFQVDATIDIPRWDFKTPIVTLLIRHCCDIEEAAGPRTSILLLKEESTISSLGKSSVYRRIGYADSSSSTVSIFGPETVKELELI